MKYRSGKFPHCMQTRVCGITLGGIIPLALRLKRFLSIRFSTQQTRLINSSARFGSVISLATWKKHTGAALWLIFRSRFSRCVTRGAEPGKTWGAPAQVAVYQPTCSPGDSAICCSFLRARAFPYIWRWSGLDSWQRERYEKKRKKDKSHCALCDAVLFRRDTVNPHPSTSFTLDTHQPKDDTCS